MSSAKEAKSLVETKRYVLKLSFMTTLIKLGLM